VLFVDNKRKRGANNSFGPRTPDFKITGFSGRISGSLRILGQISGISRILRVRRIPRVLGRILGNSDRMSGISANSSQVSWVPDHILGISVGVSRTLG